MMPDISFTQYLRPDGRQIQISIERSEAISRKAEALIEGGHSFECEELMTGHVSLTVVYDGDDIDIEVVPNGPKVPPAVDRLIERAFAKSGAADPFGG